jgi:forespore regulator of the sigma-K checkpoint
MLPKHTTERIMAVVGILLFGLSIFGLLSNHSLKAEAKKATPEERVINQNKQESQEKEENQEVIQVTAPRTITVILQRLYVDGEISEEKVEEKILSMEDFWASYDTWSIVDQSEGSITFQKSVDDISPLLKANGYFGIAGDGTLSIFKGKPDSNNVIQSFFQIDMEKLESRQHSNLKNGIPIKSKERYNQLLESYKNFSLN